MQHKTLQSPSDDTPTQNSRSALQQELRQDSRTYRFLQQHELAILSTKDRYGDVAGAVVYYTFDYNQLYILTKQGTQKARNMMQNPRVALTVYDADRLQTVQLRGTAEVELDSAVRNFVYWQIVKANSAIRPKGDAPVSKIQAGGYIVFRITPQQVNYSDFSD
ncbi:MAG TPA: pyridoxamine 5'-phosphate oxidase family protein [Candidatus Saccharimonadales bacterium]|nr:pyridoxamine 5'-phosphate oxidase family protein [Candidatus Saccharimonadales bacterium]